MFYGSAFYPSAQRIWNKTVKAWLTFKHVSITFTALMNILCSHWQPEFKFMFLPGCALPGIHGCCLCGLLIDIWLGYKCWVAFTVPSVWSSSICTTKRHPVRVVTSVWTWERSPVHPTRKPVPLAAILAHVMTLDETWCGMLLTVSS